MEGFPHSGHGDAAKWLISEGKVGLRLRLDKLDDLHCFRHDCEGVGYYTDWIRLARRVYSLEINREEM